MSGTTGLYATCTKCFTSQPIENYPWKNRLLGIRHRVCKSCTAARSKQWYRDHPEAHRQNVDANRKSYLQQNREYAWNYLATHPCVDCGESDPVVLEFDHKSGSVKRDNVSSMLTQGYSLERVKAEIEKCEVRCANCHRKKTAKERKWHGWLGKR